jgi:hypothetical protein
VGGRFQFDATDDGRPVKIVSIVDEHTRECLGGLVERSITADRLIDEVDRIAAERGYPVVLRSFHLVSPGATAISSRSRGGCATNASTSTASGH